MAVTRGCVLVTGGRRGIGRGIALAFVQDGWTVVISDVVRDADAAEETLAALWARRACSCRVTWRIWLGMARCWMRRGRRSAAWTCW